MSAASRLSRISTSKTVQELQRLIIEGFQVFDHEKTKSVDVREIGTIIRSLGCCPSEADLQQLMLEMEADGGPTTGQIHLDRFLPIMTAVLQQKKFQPVSEDMLLRAFQRLDHANSATLTKKQLEEALTSAGEPFTVEEMQEMFTAASTLMNPLGELNSDQIDLIDYTAYSRLMLQ